MFRTMGLINLHEEDRDLQDLTDRRILAATPYGGKYRLIDFVLSNMVNSGVKKVAVMLPQKSRALLDHLRSGKEWDLSRKRDGLFILPERYGGKISQSCGMVNDIEYLYQHEEYIGASGKEFVLVSKSQFICNMDYQEVLDAHFDSDADVTMVYTKLRANMERENSSFLDIDEDDIVRGISLDSKTAASDNVFMEMYILKTELLTKLIKESIVGGGGNFVARCLLSNIGKLKIKAYRFDGYVGKITSVREYYKYNMDLLKGDVWKDLFFAHGNIYTKIKDAAPAKYLGESIIGNALIANSCLVNGTVQNSILFRGVHIGAGAQINSSILMQNTKIGKNVVLENVICDKNVVIGDNRVFKGDANYPIIIKKGTII